VTWRRGWIYLSRLPGVPDEDKTVLVVSADEVGEFMRPIVVQVTSRARLRTFDTDVELREGEGGLDKNSWALCHQIVTPPDGAITEEPLSTRPISPRKMVEVNAALALALDLPSSWKSG
jgi:mRNA-degrading endonuclease toxin of MazEF toxin-antitoxin module